MKNPANIKHQKKWQSRLSSFAIAAILISIGVTLIFKVFNDNVVFYFTPSELIHKDTHTLKAPYRVGGIVKKGSIKKDDDGITIEFTITDLSHDLRVRYRGMIPNLFNEEQGTVALGSMGSDGIFAATELLAKHDENYMPKEVADSLKKSGRWQGD